MIYDDLINKILEAPKLSENLLNSFKKEKELLKPAAKPKRRRRRWNSSFNLNKPHSISNKVT